MHLASQATYVGQRLLVEGEFRLAGVPTDPMVVRCIVRSPTGVLNTLIYDQGFSLLDVYMNSYVAATIAFVVAQGVATVINFFVQRWFIFNKNRNGN